jgi:hypothetical protein
LVSPVLIPSICANIESGCHPNPWIYFAKLWVIDVVVVWHVKAGVVEMLLVCSLVVPPLTRALLGRPMIWKYFN